MAYQISNECEQCDTCRPQCPTQAIGVENGQYWINPALCDNCAGLPAPVCLAKCPTEAVEPYQAKKGRIRNLDLTTSAVPSLFNNGKPASFASSIVIWEGCNVLTQRASLPWHVDPDSGILTYERQVQQGQGSLRLHLAYPSTSCLLSSPLPTSPESLDLRAACLHLIYAAYAVAQNKPWEQDFTLTDRQIEQYLGLDKRKDLTKSAKLTLIKTLALQPCLLQVAIEWPQQGRVPSFSLAPAPLWHLLQLEHHFQTDESGMQHWVGLTLRMRAGEWSRFFLNKQDCREHLAYYQYSSLPKSILTSMMSNWQQHEGATRLMLWLLFKVRLGKQQRLTVLTLMKVAYGEDRVQQATLNPQERKRLIHTFESDLEALHHYGLKPIFDEVTYPRSIQPMWAKLSEVPEDPEAALDFWIEDAGRKVSVTDSGQRGKWAHLCQARLLFDQLPADWNSQTLEKRKPGRKSRRSQPQESGCGIWSGEQILRARQRLNLSQRELADRLGKSQSWIRDVEKGRFRVKAEEQLRLQAVLGMS